MAPSRCGGATFLPRRNSSPPLDRHLCASNSLHFNTTHNACNTPGSQKKIVRMMLGKMGLDGHDRGVKLIARALRDSGIHVIYSGLWQTPRSLAISARDEDADCIACSMMSNSHLVLVPRLIDECAKVGRPDMIINVGGIIPQEDVQALRDSGVHKVFHTGTSMSEIVDSVREATKPYASLTNPHPIAQLAR